MARGQPLVCVEGQPRTPAIVLLHNLKTAGCTLHYHGDFDWPGLRIANRLVEELDVQAWRFSAVDYACAQGKKRLEGLPVSARWDEKLEDAMRNAGVAVYEEQVMETLLLDLAVSG